MTQADYDAVICGGGVAGLSAALWLGRYRRKTLLLDTGEQRNLPAQHSHGYLTRDGATPQELLDHARGDLQRYDTVAKEEVRALSARRAGEHFSVVTGSGKVTCQRIIICTGVADEHPDLPGFEDLYGTSIFHCPCCDGFEACDQDVVVIGWGEHVAGYALDLLEWGARVTLVTNGEGFEGDDACSLALKRHSVPIIEEKITRFDATDGRMSSLGTESGREVPAELAFFSIAHHPRSELAEELGCDLDDDGYVTVGSHGETSVSGVYAAGDVTPGEQMIQVAASHGLICGIDCARSLRGGSTATGAPDPGPDPELELERSQKSI